MQNSERHSPSSWKEALKLSVRVATPFALAHIANYAVVHVANKSIDLSIPANRQPVETPEEKRFIGFLRRVDRHIREHYDRHGLDVEYETVAICGGEIDHPSEIRTRKHHRPDIVVARRGELPCAAPIHIQDLDFLNLFELGHTIIGNDDKENQANHAQQAGVQHYQQYDRNGITDLFRQFNQDPDGTVIDLFGNILFR